MANAITISVIGDTRSLVSGVDRAGTKLGGLGKTAGRAGKAIAAGLGVGVLAAGAAATAFVATSVKSLERIERIGAQTEAVIRSTGSAAGVTRAHIDELAGSLEGLTATEAESITEGANMLLTFTNIRNGVGAQNQVFDKAVVAITDMSRALNKGGDATLDTTKTAVQLGKALNDPIKGVTALAKVGVSFTEQQRDTIKALVESGDTMSAQKIILRELTKEFGGSAEAFAKTTAGKIELAKHEFGTLGETIAGALLPALGDLAAKGTEGLRWATKFAESDIAPRVGELVDYVKANRKEAIEFARSLGDRVIPILEDLGDLAVVVAENFVDLTTPIADGIVPALDLLVDIVGGAVDFLNELPGPVKDLGAQAAIAALVLPRLAAGFTAAGSAALVAGTRTLGFVAALRATGTAAQAQALGRLAGAARNAGGIAGMLALSSGAQQADKATGILLTTIGGAATGFAVGGPWGALIGGAAGAALGVFSRKAAAANESAKIGEERMRNYAASLDAVTGSVTEATRATAQRNLLESGALKTLADYGISARTAVNAALGRADASARVQAALAVEAEAVRQLKVEEGILKGVQANPERDKRLADVQAEIAAREQAAQSVADETIAVRESVKNKRAEIAATRDYSGLLKGLPRNVKTEIRENGLTPTLRGVTELARTYRVVDRKKVRTLIEAAGIEPSRRNIKKVLDQLKGLDDERVELTGFRTSFTRHIGDFRTQADRGGKDIGRKLREGTKDAKPDVAGFLTALNGGITTAKGAASSGSAGIGANLKSGFSAGFAGADGLWSAQVRAAVAATINAGRREAAIKSPSRKTYYLGEMMGKGLTDALEDHRGKAKRAGRGLVAATLAGIKSEAGLERYLARAEDLIAAAYRKRTGKKITPAQVAGYTKAIRGEVAQLREAIAAYAKAKAARAAYAADVRNNALSFADVTGVGQVGANGEQTAASIVQGLNDRLNAIRNFRAKIAALSKLNLRKDLLDDIIAKGVEGGTATAEALVAGGAGAVRAANAVQAQIAEAAKNLGTTATDAVLAPLDPTKVRDAANAAAATIAEVLRKRLKLRVEVLTGNGSNAGNGANRRTAVEPKLATRTPVAAGAAGRTTAPLEARITLTAEQLSSLERGRRISVDLKTYQRAGGR